jgi:hypothetical protein
MAKIQVRKGPLIWDCACRKSLPVLLRKTLQKWYWKWPLEHKEDINMQDKRKCMSGGRHVQCPQVRGPSTVCLDYGPCEVGEGDKWARSKGSCGPDSTSFCFVSPTYKMKILSKISSVY